MKFRLTPTGLLTAGVLSFCSSVSTMQAECGVISFTPAADQPPGDYFAYYLPHRQSGGDAGLHFR